MKQLDPRWAREGVTAALLKAAGYSADVAVKTEFAGDLPAHLSCWSDHLGRSDVTVAKVAAPASDPSLRKLPRSIQFQGTSISISVSRSLQNKHEQRKAREDDTSGKQARRKAKKVKRQASKPRSGQQRQAAPSQPAQPQLARSRHAVEQQGHVPDDEPIARGRFSSFWELQVAHNHRDSSCIGRGSTLPQAQLLRIWGLLCLLFLHPVLGCLMLLLH